VIFGCTALRAERRRALLKRHRDCAHPTLGNRPGSEVPVAHVPDGVVCHHVAGAGFVRTCPCTDESVKRHDGLHLIGLEEPIQQVHDGHRHQASHVGHPADLQSPVAPGDLELILQVSEHRRTHLGRRGHQEGPEHPCEPADPSVPLLDRVGVTRGELRELIVVGLGVVVVLRDVAAVGERQEVRTNGEHLVAVAGQL